MEFIQDESLALKGDVFKEIDKLNNLLQDNYRTENDYTQLIKLFSKSTETLLRNKNLSKL